jgi:hypothetical protein
MKRPTITHTNMSQALSHGSISSLMKLTPSKSPSLHETDMMKDRKFIPT